jgi:hypothetical protein
MRFSLLAHSDQLWHLPRGIGFFDIYLWKRTFDRGFKPSPFLSEILNWWSSASTPFVFLRGEIPRGM